MSNFLENPVYILSDYNPLFISVLSNKQDPNPFFHSDILYGWHQDGSQMQRPTHHFSFLQKQDFSSQLYTRKTNISIVLRPSQQIFLDYIHLYQETSIRDLKFSSEHTFEKARFKELELRQKQGMIRNLSR